MKRQKLTVEKRKILGKKVKKLRKDGFLPANIYGKDVKSVSVQVKLKDFEKIYKEVGETGLLDIEVDGEIRPVLIHNLQIEPVGRTPLHADFYQVNLKEKVKTMVPVIAIGEPKAVVDKVGTLLQTLSEVEVEALPEDLPEKIEINVEPMAVLDEQITIADIKAPKGVEILSDPSQVIVKIAELVSKEAEEQAAQEAAASEAAKTEAEGEEKAAEGAPIEAEEGAKETAKPEEIPADKGGEPQE